MRGGSLYWLSLICGRKFKTATHKMVMLVLADYVDEDDSCFPSQALIAGQAQISSRKAWGVLKELDEQGCIRRERRSAESGFRTSDRITLLRDGVEKLPEIQLVKRASRSAPTRTEQRDLLAESDAAYSHARATQNHPVEPPSEEVEDQRSSTNVDETIVSLCEQLADRIAAFRDTGRRPEIKPNWANDMRLLMERGPSDTKPTPIAFEVLQRAIDVVFSELAEPDKSGFCWAKNVQSPGSLRRHWDRMDAEVKLKRRGRVSRGAQSVARVMRKMNGDTPTNGALPSFASDAAALFSGELGRSDTVAVSSTAKEMN